MRIGELAARTGCSVRALRHYEHAGVLSSVRQDNGYRSFTPDDAARVRDLHVIRDRLTTQLGELTGTGPTCAPTLEDSHEPDPHP